MNQQSEQSVVLNSMRLNEKTPLSMDKRVEEYDG
jgi:hypothetical protein